MKTLTFWAVTAMILSGCGGQQFREPQSTLRHEFADAHAAVHGMVLFGTQTLHASHIPMFSAPHDYQAIFDVEISHPTKDAKAIYQSTFKDGIQTLVTLQPQPFVLPQLLGGEINSFKAGIYQGSFEQEGVLLLADVTVTVTKIKYVQHLSTQTVGLNELTYMSVSGTQSDYLAHKITAPDNFDHIVKIAWSANAAGVLDGGAIVPMIFHDTADTATNRLKVGQIFKVTKGVAGLRAMELPLSTAEHDGVSFKVVSDFYCTPGPDFAGDCP